MWIFSIGIKSILVYRPVPKIKRSTIHLNKNVNRPSPVIDLNLLYIWFTLRGVQRKTTPENSKREREKKKKTKQ